MRFLLFFLLAMTSTALADWRITPISDSQKLTANAPGILNSFRATPVQLKAVRGERVSFQFVVTAGAQAIQNLQIRPTALATIGADFVRASQMQIWRENYVFVERPSGNFDLKAKWWPDALVPLEFAPKNIEANRSAVFWATIKVPENAAAGDYFGEIDFLADGKPRRLALALNVENKTLPPIEFRATVAVYYDTLRDWYRKAGFEFSGDEWVIQKRRYYEFLLDFGLNAYDLPVDWGTPEAEQYLRDSRVHSVRTPPLNAPDFQTALNQLRATKTLDKAFYYWIDEPSPERFAEVRETTQKLRELGIPHLVTAHPNESLRDAADIWAPNVGDFFGIGHVDWKQLESERKKGRETWIYTMVEPRWPYPTWLLDDEANSVRDYGALWTQKGIQGFVYSMAHGWGPKPLEKLDSYAETSGDGTLVYPAELVGGTGPLPSIRLMLLRDALEDFALKRGQIRNAELFRDTPTLKTRPTTGKDELDATRARANDLEIPRVGWKLASDELIVYFYAPNAGEKDYVAVELAPRDAGEKWRFVATAKGNKVVERFTRDGAFRLPEFPLQAQISPENSALRWEMRIPLSDLDWTKNGVRFDAFRVNTLQNGARITQRLSPTGGDPFTFPLLQN